MDEQGNALNEVVEAEVTGDGTIPAEFEPKGEYTDIEVVEFEPVPEVKPTPKPRVDKLPKVCTTADMAAKINEIIAAIN